jgi:hypothetical protein
LTPTLSTSEIIDERISKELKLLRVVVETFLKNPELPTRDPPDYATPRNREFLANLQIPTYRNGNPSLLFHNLEMCDGNKIEKTFEDFQPLYVVITCALNPSHRKSTHPDRAKHGAC